MNLKLKGKVAVVTGGSAGIGLATATEFAKEGCRVAICARNPDKLAKAKAELAQHGGEVLTKPVDMARVEQVEDFVLEVAAHFGGLDVWVNNASAQRSKPLLDYTRADWDDAVDPGLKGVFFASQAAMRQMIESGTKGVIVNISSGAGDIPGAFDALYGMTKRALFSLTKSFASECAPYGIRVVEVAPGPVRTGLSGGLLNGPQGEGFLANIAMHRFGEPEEIARPIVFLASEEASYVTGVRLEVNGGKLSAQNQQAIWEAFQGR